MELSSHSNAMFKNFEINFELAGLAGPVINLKNETQPNFSSWGGGQVKDKRN